MIKPNKMKGFTLIELLIVVAIIAILAAIAIPNFLAAQVRAKVSRTKGDMRSLATALEAYCVDSNVYVSSSWPFRGIGRTPAPLPTQNLYLLSTPISYITSIPRTPFGTNELYDMGFGVQVRNDEYWYIDRQGYSIGYTPAVANPAFNRWIPAGAPLFDQQAIIQSAGPAGNYSEDLSLAAYGQGRYALTYDPSNGTVSQGMINRWLPWLPQGG